MAKFWHKKKKKCYNMIYYRFIVNSHQILKTNFMNRPFLKDNKAAYDNIHMLSYCSASTIIFLVLFKIKTL